MSESVQTKEWTRTTEEALNHNFPLHRACRDGDVVLLSKLLEHKDSVAVHLNLEDTYYGWTPLHWACYFGKPECLRVLLEATSVGPGIKTSLYNQSPTHIAAFAGYSKCLQVLLQAGANMNCQDYLGETPLHKASRSGSKECVTLLINNKADYTIVNNNGKNAAELAQICHQIELANILSSLQNQEPSSSCSLISSNGYYGYHPVNEWENVSKVSENEMETEMDTEDISSIANTNKFEKFTTCQNVKWPADSNGVNGSSRTNVFSDLSVINGAKRDITISEEFSQNRIPIAGKKRSIEIVSTPLMKRIRTEEEFSASTLVLKSNSSLNPPPVELPNGSDSHPASLTVLSACNNPTLRTNNYFSEHSLNIVREAVEETESMTVVTHSSNINTDTKMTWTDSFKQNGGSGSSLINPLPISATSSPSMGTGLGGCIEARARCLMGHYM